MVKACTPPTQLAAAGRGTARPHERNDLRDDDFAQALRFWGRPILNPTLWTSGRLSAQNYPRRTSVPWSNVIIRMAGDATQE